MEMTTLSGDALLQTLKQAKAEVKTGLLDVFTTKLERLAAHVRAQSCSPAELADLLEQEAEKLRHQSYEVD